MSGTLHGVGVGPGDPELVTRRAARLIAAAGTIAYPCPAGQDSLARAIVADLIAPRAREIRIDLPMTRDRAPAQAAYDAGAAEIGAVLAAGGDVVCLCEGDPLFYGSFMYLMARLRPRHPVAVTPGVTALTACAAAARVPLAARDAALVILPGTLPDDALRARMAGAGTIALMKVGRHLPRLRALLAAEGLDGTYVERASLGGERVLALADAPAEAPYFSMILAAREPDPWT